jgi:hypothetical protein
MVSIGQFDPRESQAGVLLILGVVAFLLFIGSYFVSVQVIVENPDYGDVTSTLRLAWRLIMGVATLGSFYIGIRSLDIGEGRTEGPSTSFHFEGQNHDIDFHLHVDDASTVRPSQDTQLVESRSEPEETEE